MTTLKCSHCAKTLKIEDIKYYFTTNKTSVVFCDAYCSNNWVKNVRNKEPNNK